MLDGENNDRAGLTAGLQAFTCPIRASALFVGAGFRLLRSTSYPSMATPRAGVERYGYGFFHAPHSHRGTWLVLPVATLGGNGERRPNGRRPLL